MRCLNPECGSLDADEINLTLNVSNTEPGEELPIYSGSTDYAINGMHPPIGTTCLECNKDVFYTDWVEIIENTFGSPNLIVEARPTS